MHFTLPYERQGHSQFGETGIIELLLAGLRDPHQTFVEIGFGTGNQNMTMDLLDRGYRGVGVDGREWEPDTPNRWGDAVTKLKQMITAEDIVDVLRPVADWNTDFFSLDIDSFDYEKYKLVPIENVQNVQRAIRKIKVDEQTKQLEDEIAATAGGNRFGNKFKSTDYDKNFK